MPFDAAGATLSVATDPPELPKGVTLRWRIWPDNDWFEQEQLEFGPGMPERQRLPGLGGKTVKVLAELVWRRTQGAGAGAAQEEAGVPQCIANAALKLGRPPEPVVVSDSAHQRTSVVHSAATCPSRLCPLSRSFSSRPAQRGVAIYETDVAVTEDIADAPPGGGAAEPPLRLQAALPLGTALHVDLVLLTKPRKLPAGWKYKWERVIRGDGGGGGGEGEETVLAVSGVRTRDDVSGGGGEHDVVRVPLPADDGETAPGLEATVVLRLTPFWLLGNVAGRATEITLTVPREPRLVRARDRSPCNACHAAAPLCRRGFSLKERPPV